MTDPLGRPVLNAPRNWQQPRREIIMTDNYNSFIAYWDEVDQALLRFYGIHSGDAGIEAADIAHAQEDATTPEDFALWWGEKYRLTNIAEFKAKPARKDDGTPSIGPLNTTSAAIAKEKAGAA
jgi:hypothetical protein